MITHPPRSPRPRSLFVLAVSVVLALPTADAAGQADSTPPVITSLSITPNGIDTTITFFWITILIGFTDDLTGIDVGVAGAPCRLQGPETFACSGLQLVSGDVNAGTLQATLFIPFSSALGEYRLMEIVLRDSAGNEALLPDPASMGLSNLLANVDWGPPFVLEFPAHASGGSAAGGGWLLSRLSAFPANATLRLAFEPSRIFPSTAPGVDYVIDGFWSFEVATEVDDPAQPPPIWGSTGFSGHNCPDDLGCLSIRLYEGGENFPDFIKFSGSSNPQVDQISITLLDDELRLVTPELVADFRTHVQNLDTTSTTGHWSASDQSGDQVWGGLHHFANTRAIGDLSDDGRVDLVDSSILRRDLARLFTPASPAVTAFKLRDATDDRFLQPVRFGDVYSLSALGSCLAIQVELNAAATSLRYDWTAPGGSEVVAYYSEINEPFCWATETGWAFEPEVADCGCSPEMSQLGKHRLVLTPCSHDVNFGSGETCAGNGGIEGAPITLEFTIEP